MNKNQKTGLFLGAAAGLVGLLLVKRKAEGGEATYFSVFGKVIDSSNSLPVPNAIVQFGTGQVLTDAQGNYSFENVPYNESLNYIIYVDKDAYYSVSQTITPPNTGSITIDIMLDPVTEPPPPPPQSDYSGQIRGHVTSEGQPVVSAMVTLTYGNDSVHQTTDASGYYEFSANTMPPIMTESGQVPWGVIPGFTLDWRVDAQGYDTKTGSFTVVSGWNTIDIQLSPSAPPNSTPFTFEPLQVTTKQFIFTSPPYYTYVWKALVPKVTCVITNNSGAAVTHTLAAYADTWDDYTGQLLGSNQMQGFPNTPRTITLQPGQSATLLFDGENYDDPTVGAQFVLIPNNYDAPEHGDQHKILWIQDENGNKSQSVRIG